MKATRGEILQLAAKAMLDPRSARKAIENGPDSLKGDAGVRAERGMRALQLGRFALTSCDEREAV